MSTKYIPDRPGFASAWSHCLVLAVVLCAVALMSACGDDDDGRDCAAEPDGCSLRAVARDAGLYVGAAVEPRLLASEPVYRETFRAEFNSLTAENRMKWANVHPQRDVWVFEPADELVEFAESNGMRIRGHALFWGRLSLPDYVSAAANAEEARELLSEHIAAVAGRWAGRIAQWDVVNEPLTLTGRDQGTGGFQDNVLWRFLGPDYVAEALHMAHAADPAARLYINDFLVLRPGEKQDRFFDLAQHLLEIGAPLHGVGIQGHFETATAEEIDATMRRFASLGLEIELTEVDYGIDAFPGTLEEKLAAQAQAYETVVAGCVANRACKGVTTWGVTDQYSWLGVERQPLLFDPDGARKPAYFSFRDALAGPHTSDR